MALARVAVLSPGDMGAGIAAALGRGGRRVVTALDGRSEATRARAARAGIEDRGSLGAALAGADLVLSILPPASAEALAAACARAAPAAGAPLYVDCNAVSPATAERIAAVVAAAGFEVADGGIIGAAPGRGALPTRLYVSGPRAEALAELADPAAGLEVHVLGPGVGRASGLKMAYAGLTKGTHTLGAAVLMLAERLGLYDALHRELARSQEQALARMGILPFLPADAGRWIGEMEEIAATFAAAGLPAGFHEAAREIYAAMARTPWAAETRETLDRTRTLADAIRGYLAALE